MMTCTVLDDTGISSPLSHVKYTGGPCCPCYDVSFLFSAPTRVPSPIGRYAIQKRRANFSDRAHGEKSARTPVVFTCRYAAIFTYYLQAATRFRLFRPITRTFRESSEIEFRPWHTH
ncbi:hypothetical protein MRX96_033334 [Rhipicephalus microplus]